MQSGLRLALLKPAALLVTPLPDPPLSLLFLRCKEQRKEKYAGSENHSPHEIKEK
jgi:hypothetical protein